MGNKSSDTWGYVIIIIVLAILFILILPVIGIMYMDIHQERILMAADLKRLEKLKKELETQRDKSNQ